MSTTRNGTGLILFTLYIIELSNLPTSGEIFSLADDTTYERYTYENLRESTEQILRIIIDFDNEKRLTISLAVTSHSISEFESLYYHLISVLRDNREEKTYQMLLYENRNCSRVIFVNNCQKTSKISNGNTLQWIWNIRHLKTVMFIFGAK